MLSTLLLFSGGQHRTQKRIIFDAVAADVWPAPLGCEGLIIVSVALSWQEHFSLRSGYLSPAV